MILDAMLASYAALWLIVLLNAVLLIATLRSLGLLLMRFPAAGALVLSDQGPSIGETIELAQISATDAPGRYVVVFLSPGCALCRKVAPSLNALSREATPVILIKGDEEQARPLMQLLGDAAQFAQLNSDAFTQLGIDVTPFALVIDRTRRVLAKGLVNSIEQLESLLVVTHGGRLWNESLAKPSPR